MRGEDEGDAVDATASSPLPGQDESAVTGASPGASNTTSPSRVPRDHHQRRGDRTKRLDKKKSRRRPGTSTTDPKLFVSSLTRQSLTLSSTLSDGGGESHLGERSEGGSRSGSRRSKRRFRTVTSAIHPLDEGKIPFNTTGGRMAFVRRWEYKENELAHAADQPGPGQYFAELRAAKDNDGPKFTMYGRIGKDGKTVSSLSELGAGSCGMEYSGFGSQVDATKPTAGRSRFGGRDSRHADLLKMEDVLAHHNLHDKQMKKIEGIRGLKSSAHSLKGLPGPGTYKVPDFTRDIMAKFDTKKTSLAQARRMRSRRLYR